MEKVAGVRGIVASDCQTTLQDGVSQPIVLSSLVAMSVAKPDSTCWLVDVCRRATSAIAFLFTLAPLAVLAQATPPPPLREATAELAYVGTSGNSSTQSIGLNGEYIYRPDEWVATTKAVYVRNQSEGELKAESFDLTFKASRIMNPRLSAFGRYEFQHDRFAGIEARNAVEAGLAFVMVDAAPHSLTLDASLGYAHESRVSSPDLSDPIAAAGGLYRLKLSDAVDVSDDARFSVALSNGNDWRFANVAAINSKLNKVLALKVSNTLRYVHAPAPTFQTTDRITAVALVAKF
jgi:putative salt-induced outer membrane protein